MRHRSIFHHIRFIIVLSMGLGIGLLFGGVYYINQSGVNDEWRARIAQELENLGIVADFESLRFEFSRGLVATGVRVYADDSRDDIVAKLEHLVIDVDKTKLMRGLVRVDNVSLKKADISLPIDLNDPTGLRITMTELKGDMFLPDKSTLEAREIEGVIAGVRLSLNARVWSDRVGASKRSKPLRETRVARLKFINRIVDEIGKWHWPEDKPPRLKLYLQGNIDNPNTARLDFILNAPELERRGVVLTDVRIEGDYNNQVITLETIRLKDSAGSLNAKAAYRLASQSGRFEAASTLHIQMLSRQLFGVDIMNQLTFSTPPAIVCTGKISFDDDFIPNVIVTGHANIDDFSFIGSRFKHLKTDFSSQGRDAFLTGLQVTHDQGELKGRILLKNETIRYEAESTLPPSAYAPFLIDSGIERALRNADFTPESKIHIKTKGTMNRHKLNQWEAEGYAMLENFSYQDTPLHSLSGDYSLSDLLSEFTNIRANFDYNDYILKRKHEGPSSARIAASSINVDMENKIVSLNNITGTAWPAPIVRLFVPNVANHVEVYRFHRPPNLFASGVFDLAKPYNKTDFTIDVSSPGSMSYEFLGEPLTMSRLKANVQILGGHVHVSELLFNTFQGACGGNIHVKTSDPTGTSYSGDIQFRRLHLKDIGELYQFDNADRGLLTGRIDFSGKNNQISKFNAKGSIALEKGNLFSIPMLGPISPLVGVVLRERNPTKETAKDASCTYVIRDGVVYSNDFLATTRSLKFTGEGNIDLEKKQIDLLVRMNARGLFSFITLPLRPFIGLFQFKGNGPIMNPTWKTTMFTTPNRGKDDPIFRKPPKASLITE